MLPQNQSVVFESSQKPNRTHEGLLQGFELFDLCRPDVWATVKARAENMATNERQGIALRRKVAKQAGAKGGVR